MWAAARPKSKQNVSSWSLLDQIIFHGGFFMIGESFLALACAGLIALIFGTTLTFAGYRFFLFLLPVWGFFFGLALGAQTVQALFGDAFLATITSWVVGFIVAVIFAVLSYLFYFFAVILISGSLGYAVTVGILLYFGMNMNFLTWLIGIVVAIAVAFVTIRFNLQKWVIMIATSVLGASVVIGTFVLMFNPASKFLENPVKAALSTSWLLTLVFLAMAIFGVVVQYRQNKTYVIESYDRW
jgi:hypothetical protein